MAWGDNGNNQQGPWGKPPGGPQRPKKPEGASPDLDALFRKGQDKFRNAWGGKNGGDNTRRSIVLLAATAGLLWLASGIYFVKADEEGIVMRFGRFHRTAPPGMGYHLPWPVETVRTPKVTAVNRTEIGFRAGGFGQRAAKPESDLPEESLMLTGDENIVDINFEVQWKIARAQDFLFNVRNPEETVKSVSESAMREVIGQSQIATVLAEGKLQVEQQTRKLIQSVLDSYGTGVEVVSVNLLKVDPPSQVIDAFRDVQTARADLETAQNQAEAYRNDILPRARGESQKLVLDAEAYKQEVIARASGEAARFASVYTEYKQARDVTRKRLYFEAMEDILRNMQKTILGRQGAVPYLPLNTVAPKTAEPPKPDLSGLKPAPKDRP